MPRSLRRYLRFAVLGITDHPKRPRRFNRKPRLVPRSESYKAWVRTLSCAACETDQLIQAAHTGSDGGTALKASDYSCVPLCQGCHTGNPRAYHQIGRDAFERLWNLSFVEIVARLNAVYQDSRRRGRG